MRLYGWSMSRGRGNMTALGVGDDGAEAKVAGIVKVEPRGRLVIATDSKGEEHELVVGGQTN